jgi:beta-glucanase (GH16 family)
MLLLVAGTVAALLIGAFVVVLVAVDPSSPGPSPSPTPRPKSPTPAAAVAARDDFTAATLDKTRWAVYGTNGQGSYEANMVRVSGGELQVLGVGSNPTAAANHSGGLCWCVDGNHRYGSWQVRARFDAGSGYRQVFELWPQSESATADGSINFASDGDAAKKVLGLVLQPPAGGGTAVHASRNGDFTAWHVYRVDWRATYVRMYVDDALAYDSTTSTTPLTIPHTPMHLVIQQDKGPGNGVPAANAQTPAQVVMHVDWVRFDP